MGRERPEDYPKLENYKPTRFILTSSHYDKKKEEQAVTFIANRGNTKGK